MAHLPHEELGPCLGLQLGTSLLANLDGTLFCEVTNTAGLQHLLAVSGGNQAAEVQLAVLTLEGIACTAQSTASLSTTILESWTQHFTQALTLMTQTTVKTADICIMQSSFMPSAHHACHQLTSNGGPAGAVQGSQERPLADHSQAGLLVVQASQVLLHGLIVGAASNADGTLADSGQHLLNGDDAGGVLGQVQTLQASQSQHGALAGTLLQLAQTGLHVAAEVLNLHK